MAIHQSHRQSDLEKRLKLLRQQVYGKSSEYSESSDKSEGHNIRKSDDLKPATASIRYADTQIHRYTDTPSSDITYLHQDLLKISLLASLALGAQIILFYLLKNNVLRINLL